MKATAGKPRVSVLVAARDAAATLESALRSVQRQTMPEWECVVVDDRSGDRTAGIAREFARSDARFRVLECAGEGVIDARNTGLDACRGEAIAIFDADDVMRRARLERQWHALVAAPELGAVGCRVRLFPRSALGEGMERYESWLHTMAEPGAVARERYVECPVAHPSLMVRAAALRELAYEDHGWPEDYDLVLRLLEADYGIAVLPERLLAWRYREDSATRTDPRYSLERFAACKAASLARGFLEGRDEYVLWGYGDTGRSLRRALLAHGKSPSHVVEIHPGRLGNQIHGAEVIAPSTLRSLRPDRLLVSVAGPQARRLIRESLHEMEFLEGFDWFACA